MAPLRVVATQFLIGFLFFLHAESLFAHAISVMKGTIKFPQTIKTVCPYKIFYEGQQIKTEVEGNELIFILPMHRISSRFFVLFVEEPHYVLKDHPALDAQNTIDYLKSGTVYRIFELQYASGTWRCTEYLLPDSLIIPDNTILIYMPPSYIESFVGGNRNTLPRIVVKENILDLIGGSLETLKAKAEELIMEAINMNTLHVPVQEATRIAGNKRLVVPTV